MKNWLMVSLLALGIALPAVAHAASSATEEGDGGWCWPCCGCQ